MVMVIVVSTVLCLRSKNEMKGFVIFTLMHEIIKLNA